MNALGKEHVAHEQNRTKSCYFSTAIGFVHKSDSDENDAKL